MCGRTIEEYELKALDGGPRAPVALPISPAQRKEHRECIARVNVEQKVELRGLDVSHCMAMRPSLARPCIRAIFAEVGRKQRAEIARRCPRPLPN